VAVDVLDDDDRVVDEHAERQDQREQHDDVEGHVEHGQHDEADQHAQRNGDGDEERVAKAPHEEEQHARHEDQAREDVVLELGDAIVDVLRDVTSDRVANSIAALGALLVENRLRLVRDSQDVLAGAAGHRERERRHTLDPRVGRLVLVAVHHAGHLPDAYRLAVDHPDHHVLDLGDGLELAWHAHRIFQLADLDRPAGHIEISLLDRRRELVEAYVVVFQKVGIGLDCDLALEATDQLDLEHAFDALELVLELFGMLLELVEPHLATDVDDHDGELAERDLLDRRLVGQIARQLRSDRVDLLAHLLQRIVDVHVGLELDRHDAHAVGRRRRQIPHVLEVLQLVLERTCDQLLDVGG